MQRLTLGLVKRETARALVNNGFFQARVMSAKWIGKRSKARCGPEYFRVARVWIDFPPGDPICRLVSIDTDGGHLIQ